MTNQLPYNVIESNLNQKLRDTFPEIQILPTFLGQSQFLLKLQCSYKKKRNFNVQCKFNGT